MESVASACSRDVALLCPIPSDFLSRDPILDFIMSPSPLMLDSSFMDQMLNSAIRMAADQPMGTTWTIVYDLGAEQKPRELEMANNVVSLPRVPTTAENVLDSMVSTLAEKSAADPFEFVKRLQEHGNTLLLDSTISEERRRLARRLSEASPTSFSKPRLPLPFGCPKNRCLMAAYSEGATSDRCSDALKAAENVRDLEVAHETLLEQKESDAFLGFTFLYAILAFCTLAMVHKRFSKLHIGRMEHLRLKRSILQAVYSNPEIKASVEFQLQEEIGGVPPLPPHVLERMGGMKFPRGFFCCKVVRVFMMVLIVFLAFAAPLLAMPLLCIIMAGRCLSLSLCPTKPPVRMCSCCCCGVTTEDVKNGTVSATQACCTCCNGLGVCGPLCTSCCGTDPEEACGCCSGDCDCCNPVPKCTCCCCGLTNWDAKKGMMTDEQACCTCCAGTGSCGEGCMACCGDSGDGCGCCAGDCDCCSGASSPVVKESKVVVYQGIPIQLV